MNVAEAHLWGSRVGAVAQTDASDPAVFEFDPEFVASGFDVSPIEMPLAASQYRFPGLPRDTFSGLPGLLADSLPDKFGNRLIDQYLAASGRTRADFNSVERLCYIGTRGMGALEFTPATGPAADSAQTIDISELRALASEVVEDRASWSVDMTAEGAIHDILLVGTSAGGARAKAVVAWNPATNELRSGQTEAPEGFEQWLLKFDGVSDDDREVGSGKGYGKIEFAYSLMAAKAGIKMRPCRLFREGDRAHFMTQRFDRVGAQDKLHMQTLGGLCHFDFNDAGAYSYEQTFLAIRQLGLTVEDREQQFLRMVFNAVARNQDDHVKNIAFLMDHAGAWSLSPAYDLSYAYNPTGKYTSAHQITINGKRDDFTFEDFEAVSESALLKRARWRELVDNVVNAVKSWPEFAEIAGVPEQRTDQIAATHRLRLAAE